MSEQPYMQLWIADFLGDTLHLSDAEVGQYVLLLMAMWRNGGSLPDEPTKLARIARAKVSDEVMAFFSKCEANASITQKRLLAELEKARGKSVKRSEAGKAGVKAKALKYHETPKAIATANAIANGQAKVKHLPEPDTPNGVSDTTRTPRSELLAVLDVEHADAIIAHRKVLKPPLNAYSAKLLAGRLGQLPDPNAAADEMIARGWKSIKPEWMQETQNRSHAPPQSPIQTAIENVKAKARAQEHAAEAERGETDEFAHRDRRGEAGAGDSLFAFPGGRRGGSDRR